MRAASNEFIETFVVDSGASKMQRVSAKQMKLLTLCVALIAAIALHAGTASADGGLRSANATGHSNQVSFRRFATRAVRGTQRFLRRAGHATRNPNVRFWTGMTLVAGSFGVLGFDQMVAHSAAHLAESFGLLGAGATASLIGARDSSDQEQLDRFGGSPVTEGTRMRNWSRRLRDE
jgi:hypothetical protein